MWSDLKKIISNCSKQGLELIIGLKIVQIWACKISCLAKNMNTFTKILEKWDKNVLNKILIAKHYLRITKKNI